MTTYQKTIRLVLAPSDRGERHYLLQWRHYGEAGRGLYLGFGGSPTNGWDWSGGSKVVQEAGWVIRS